MYRCLDYSLAVFFLQREAQLPIRCMLSLLEHSDSGKKYPIRFDSTI